MADAQVATIEANLTNLVRNIVPYGIKNNVGSDELPINVIITTIPPLGLAANDPKEQRRQKINSDIVNYYGSFFGADGYADFDSAVRDTTNKNQTAAAYLTNGAPNASYYQALASAAGDALSQAGLQ